MRQWSGQDSGHSLWATRRSNDDSDRDVHVWRGVLCRWSGTRIHGGTLTEFRDLLGWSVQSLRTRVMVLEAAIDEHRREVRDGIPRRWGEPIDPNVRLWRTIGEDDG